MSLIVSRSLVVAAASLALASPALGQSRSAVTGNELDVAAAARPATTRAAVAEYFSTDAARALAARMGITQSDLQARIAGLDQASLDRIGDKALAGGSSTIVISTTAIIIALLLLILLTH